jgi:Lysylphosphatidylglycerol synthase TM region
MIFTQQAHHPSFVSRLYATALRYQKLVTWGIMLVAYGYLGFQLFNFKHYRELLQQWESTSLSQFGWLAAVFILLPLNWSLEAIKWQKLTEKVQKISFKIALQSVFAGIYTGFFTPNRVSEMLGRVLFLDSENRKSGAVLSIVNSLTQNIIMTLCGIPACFYFFSLTSKSLNPDASHFIIWVALFLLFSLLFYFLLPYLSRRNWFSKITPYTSKLSAYNRTDLFRILLLSLLRYIVFCIQFFLMLRFFGVSLEPLHALIAIPANYLFVTYTPSIAFSEAAVRSSYAILFIGAFSTQLVGIALAGVCIWAVNFGVPLMIGSIIMLRIQESFSKV